jgi:hypothetical protein
MLAALILTGSWHYLCAETMSNLKQAIFSVLAAMIALSLLELIV